VATRRAYEGDDRVGFLAISIAGPPARVAKEAERMGLDWPLALTYGDLLSTVGLWEVPATVFVSADGRIVGVAEGGHEEAFFRKRTEWLLDR
jgi:hypothetical protein